VTNSLLFAALTVCAAVPASAANLLNNGSFETPDIVGTNIYHLYNPGSTEITGWTVLGGQVHNTPDTYLGLKASDGRQWIDLTGITGYNKGLRSDAVDTAIGKVYTLSFDVGNYLPFGFSTLGMSINGGNEQTFTNLSLASTSTSPMNWAHFSLDWLADASTAQFSFLGRANGALSNDLGIGLDNVYFAEKQTTSGTIPEPQTTALMAAGLIGIAALLRRRQHLQS